MNSKPKVLLSFVGNRDPYDKIIKRSIIKKTSFKDRLACLFSGCSCKSEVSVEETEGSVLSLCRHLQPDRVYLFPSSEGKNPTLENAKLVKSILEELFPSICCEILPLKGEDPTDFEALSQEFRQNIQLVSAQLGEVAHYSFHINCSSGTQQMSSLAYVFAGSGIFPGVERWQCKDPKFSTPQDRIRPIYTVFLEEHTLIQKIKRAVEIFAFQSMAEDCALLAEKNLSSERKAIAVFLAKLFEAYAYQDILRHQEAYNIVKVFALNKEEYPFLDDDLAQILKFQIRILKVLQNGTSSENLENLTDLYFNMWRCYDRGAYTDVLARFWRVGEGTVYFRLANKWGINPRNVANSPNKQNLHLVEKNRDLLEIHGKLDRFMQFNPGRKALREIFRDEDYETLWENYLQKSKRKKSKYEESKITNLIKYRNDTIVAHGMKPVSQAQAEECLEIAEAMLLALVPGAEKAMEEYPFRKENLEKIVTLLDRP